MSAIAKRLLPWLIGTVAVGAAYEFAVDLGAIGLGPQPGDGPAGATTIVPLALLSLLVTGGLLLVAAIGGRSRIAWGRMAVPAAAAAAAFLVARFYSYDPYYAPDLRRMSDGGAVAGSWIAFLVGATLLTAILAWRWPRAASAGTAVGVWAIALTAFAAGLGH